VRVAVPADLRPLVGKHEIIKSLRTRDYAVALRRLVEDDVEEHRLPRDHAFDRAAVDDLVALLDHLHHIRPERSDLSAQDDPAADETD
jgi:hypothetical protein